MSKVTFTRLTEDAVIPEHQTAGAAGYDLHTVSEGIIEPGCSATLRTGFALNVPFTVLGYMMGRSGFALRFGLDVRCSYVKSGEELLIHVTNRGHVPFTVEKLMRVAQLVFLSADVESVCVE